MIPDNIPSKAMLALWAVKIFLNQDNSDSFSALLRTMLKTNFANNFWNLSLFKPGTFNE